MEKDKLLQHLIKSWEDSPYPTFKISSYFPAYVELFGHLVNTNCVFIETGILDGGSLFMWRKWLGPEARIIGIDLNPGAAKWRDSGFEIFIGDQGDPEFWRKTLKEIGDFDALLDDGGHQTFQQIVTAREAIGMAKKNCVVAIEDTACSFMKDFSSHGSFTFLEYSKDATDILTGRSSEMYGKRFPDVLNHMALDEFKTVYSIQFYNSIVAFHVNHDFAKKPELMRNRPPVGSSDFRYEGRDFALVNWPTVFTKNRVIKVDGGETSQVKIANYLKSILPAGIKKAIKLLIGRS
jgi:hypothetical protein